MSVKRLTQMELLQALEAIGVRSGDIVHIQSSLPHLGPVEAGESRENILAFYDDTFRKILGSKGTLLVHTPFEDYARYGTPFVLEESPSRAGVFSEYIRTKPGAVRSVHPIVSTAGIGPMANEICSGPHYDGFGYFSSWGRMHRCNVLFITLGLSLRSGLSFAHYCESLYGVPYQYCKIYNTIVYKAGKKVDATFTMRVRYLDFSIAVDILKYQEALFSSGVASTFKCGRGVLQAVRAQPAFDVGMKLLSENIYSFLRHPPDFRAGEIPLDGPTGHIQYEYNLAHGKAPERNVSQPNVPYVANFDVLQKQSDRIG